mmetsp:Transcript_105009/g.321775  ORF Transcript_105009/g.321775 Transcript_105009/m.321775 type:complete len:239 (-) Transcript_105009:149-865(-)
MVASHNAVCAQLFGEPGSALCMLDTIVEHQPLESRIDNSFVCYIGDDSGTADAERVGAPAHCAKGGRCEAQAHAVSPPLNIQVDLPRGHCLPGQPILVHGPQGPVCLRVPPGATPGARLTFQIAPRPEFRVEVPPGAGPGWVMTFHKDDGGECRATVPPGLQPGDTFEVTPPALMVRVPEDAQPGDFVRFSRACDLGATTEGPSSTELFRARIPEGLQPCMYFAARLPFERAVGAAFQ